MVLEAAGVSPGGIKVGLRVGLGGKGPIGRSGSGGRSVLAARTGRLVSEEVDMVRGFMGGGSGWLSSIAPSELAFLSSSSLL